MAKKHGILKTFLQDTLDGLAYLVFWVIKLAILGLVLVGIVVGELAIFGKAGNYSYGWNIVISLGVAFLLLVIVVVYGIWMNEYIEVKPKSKLHEVGQDLAFALFIISFVVWALSLFQIGCVTFLSLFRLLSGV